ncbi:putative immunity protein [Geodermatophilus sp. SYSU D00079]
MARARAFARGDLNTAKEIRRRFSGGVGAGDVQGGAASAAARAAGQAVAVCHIGAHALGAAAYAPWRTRTGRRPSKRTSVGNSTACPQRFAARCGRFHPLVRTRQVPSGRDCLLQVNSAPSSDLQARLTRTPV